MVQLTGARPNNSSKPTPLRCGPAVAKKACHRTFSTTQRGLTQALGALMHIDQALNLLRAANQPVPLPLRLPTEDEIVHFERELRFHFPSDFRQFQLAASNVTYGTLEPVICIPGIGPPMNPIEVANDGWTRGVPRDWLPFCQDNDCFFCISKDGVVAFWDNADGRFGRENWSLAQWIETIWLGRRA